MQGGMRDAGERFSSKKSLVTGNQHVGKSQQALEHIILYDLIGQILKEQVTFLLEYTSRPREPIFPDFNPATTARVSIVAPRLVLISMTPSFMRPTASAPIR